MCPISSSHWVLFTPGRTRGPPGGLIAKGFLPGALLAAGIISPSFLKGSLGGGRGSSQHHPRAMNMLLSWEQGLARLGEGQSRHPKIRLRARLPSEKQGEGGI